MYRRGKKVINGLSVIEDPPQVASAFQENYGRTHRQDHGTAQVTNCRGKLPPNPPGALVYCVIAASMLEPPCRGPVSQQEEIYLFSLLLPLVLLLSALLFSPCPAALRPISPEGV